MSLSLGLAGVEAGALQHHVHTDLAPRQLGSVGLGIDGDLLADVIIAGLDGVLVLTDLAQEAALSGVVLQQVSQHRRAGQVVDGHNLVALSLKHLTESQAADAAETIDRNFNCHCYFPP